MDCTKQDFNGMQELHYSRSLSADQMTSPEEKKNQTKVHGLNPLTATGCKHFQAEKCLHKPAKQYIFWSCNKSVFCIVRFDGNPFMPMQKDKQKDLKNSNFTLLLAVFKLRNGSKR